MKNFNPKHTILQFQFLIKRFYHNSNFRHLYRSSCKSTIAIKKNNLKIQVIEKYLAI